MFSLLLLALPALSLASSRAHERLHQLERRSARGLGSGPLQLVEPVAGNGTENGLEGEAQVAYSKNWAGVVLQKVPGGGHFEEVQGTIHVPTPKMPSGGNKGKKYQASAWVGIDGDTCSSAILQTGIDFSIQNGHVTYDHWYEWYPAYAYSYSNNLQLRAGDKVTMKVVAQTKTHGVASIVNHRNGRKSTKKLHSTHKLCLKNAEWIVERFQSGNSLVPFADWKGAVTFTDASAKTSKKTVGPTAGTGVVVDLKTGSKVNTKVTKGKRSVTVKHT